MTAIEYVDVLDRVVHLAVLELGQAISVIAFKQHADERMQEVQMLRRRLEREGIDRVVPGTETDFEVASSEQRRQLAVAVAQIQDDRERVVLLRVRREEIGQEALPAAGRTQDERVPHVLDVQVERVRRVMRGFEYRECLAAKVAAGSLARVEREQEAQIRSVRLQDSEPAQIVSAVPGHDAQPGVQQVVRLLEQAAVVDSHRLLGFGCLVLKRPRILPVYDDGQRCAAEEMPVHFELGQSVAELSDGRACRIVDQHFFRPSLRRNVVDDRDALVEKVPATRLQLPPHFVARRCAAIRDTR